jgi:hypothetical protein
MRILLSHAGPRPWIGRWPPPARALAGRKVGREMRRNRSSTLLRRLTLSLALVALLALAFQSAVPTRALARVAPTTVASGDPTVDDEGPSPGPKKAAAITQVVPSVQTTPRSFWFRLSVSWWATWLSFARSWL